MSASLAPLPITPELWERLRRLDPHCYISITRNRPSANWRTLAVRTWQISIQPDKLNGGSQWVHAEHSTLANALRIAIEDAELRGWTR